VSAGFLACAVILTALSAIAVPLSGDLPPLPRMHVRAGFVVLGAVLGLGVAASLAWRAGPESGIAVEIALVLSVATAVCAGGPVTTSVLRLADRHPPDGHVPRDSKGPADPTVLHGGAWIGALERLAAAGSLLAGYPDGLIVLLGIKGLGRYPELHQPAAPERFIIGTLTSVMWAVACAGVGYLLLH
jgi:hypothetical protein